MSSDHVVGDVNWPVAFFCYGLWINTSGQTYVLFFWLQLCSSPLMYTSSFVVLVSCLLAHYYYYCVTRTRCKCSGFLLYLAWKENVFVRERRTFYVYIQINAELDLEGWETLCSKKKKKMENKNYLSSPFGVWSVAFDRMWKEFSGLGPVCGCDLIPLDW